MVKSIRRALVLLTLAFFTAFVVLQAIGLNGTSAGAAQADSVQGGKNMLLADDYELSTSVEISEPKGSDLVTVIVDLGGTPMIDFATAQGISVAESLQRYDGMSNLNRLNRLYESAQSALSGVLVSTGYRYTTVLNGFSAKIYYRDLEKLESYGIVEDVILSNTYEAPQAITENVVNVHDTGIYDSSDVDYDGTGTVVAVLDTGTDYTHEVFDMELDADTLALSKDDIAAIVPNLAATSLSASLESPVSITEDDLYLSSKLPYAYDYADLDTNVYPTEAHGTHVAGIIAGKSDVITGVATGAQIATFKVFPDTGTGAETNGILAALNDAVLLGVDAINMSLGSSCGFTREGDDDAVNEVYDRVEASGICLVVAASNDYSSAYGSANGNTNLASNPDSGTVGSPASYTAALAVASISGVKTRYMYANGEREIYFQESRTTGKEDSNDFVGGMLGTAHEGEFEYVVIPGTGIAANYVGLDVKGKLAVVRRGSNSFEDKIRNAYDQGAIGVIIYNNVSGTLNMSVGTRELIPSCLVSMDLGEYLASTGTGTIKLSQDYLAGPFMSDFSSWGVLPNLVLSPDITAHGGEITSSYPGGNEYDTISGTSMACPNLAGALILVRQYVKSLDDSLTTNEVRDLSYSLLMSTAGIARNEEGNPYSPRKQGAGLADIARSISTKAYLTVDGSNKPKISYGDDPARTGVYELEFNITNMSGDALSYRINPIVMTESMSSDGRTVAEKAYMLGATSDYSVSATQGSASLNGNCLSLSGYGSAKITVTITLTDADKAYLEEHFVNGMYVEGYVELQSLNEDGVNLNLPYLAFYGDWTDAPMLDVTAYEVGESQVDSSVLAEDKLVADVYGTLPMAGFNTTGENNETTVGSWGLGAFSYNVADGYETPATLERYASLTSSPDGNYMIYTIAAGLLRGAKKVDMEIRDSITGELIWEKTDYNARKSHSSGGEQTGGVVMVEFDVREMGLANNSRYTFSMECYLDIPNEEGDYDKGNTNTFSFEFTIDDEKPVLLDTYVRDTGTSKTLEFYVYDNHYLQGAVVYTYSEKLGENNYDGLTSISNGVIPITDGVFNGTTRVSVPVTAYWSTIQRNGGKLYVQLMDYAKNTQVFEITLDECGDIRLEKTRNARDTYAVDINGQFDLEQYVRIFANVRGEYLENYWTEDLVWTSSDPDTVDVYEGLVTGLKTGSAVITVRDPQGNSSLSFTIEVGERVTEIGIRELELSDNMLSLERGESTTIEVTLKPYNYKGDVTLLWSSSNATVTVTPDPENQYRATVTAVRTGVAATVTVRVDGLMISDSCRVVVKEEYEVDSIYLRSYTGRGDENGVVEIPDDLGIVYIYPMAFFNNPYITKIILPEGVQYIMRAGIYGCENLEEVVLPTTLTEIQTFGLAWNPKLSRINLENVSVIGSRAFIYDTSLTEVDLSRTTFIKNMAFYGCSSLKSVDLSKVGVVDSLAFAYCTALTELTLPANTGTHEQAFYGCSGLTHLTVYADSIGAYAFAGCSNLKSVTFAGDVDLIDEAAFYGCSSLESVRFLGTVYEIDAGAFAGCTSLSEFTFAAGLTKLGSNVLDGCESLSVIRVSRDAKLLLADVEAFLNIPSLTAFEVESGNKYLSSEDGVLYDVTKYTLLAYPSGKTGTSFTVPASVRTIAPSAFAGITLSVNLNGTERIEESAFRGASVTLTGYENVRYIGDYAFYGSTLRTLPVGERTTYLGAYAFAGCTSLTARALTLPASLVTLGESAFRGTPVTSVTFPAALDYAGAGAFAECTSLTSVNFGGLRALGAELFAGCTSLETVVLPDTVEEIGEGVFSGATRLRSVTLPASLTAIPARMLQGTAVTSIDLPGTVTSIGDGAFESTPLASIDLSSVLTVGARAFYETQLYSLTSDSILSVGSEAFAGSALRVVELGAVETIGGSAFAGCSDLVSAYVFTVRELGARAFYGCASLTDLDVGRAQTVGDEAFAGAASLTALELPAVRELGAQVISGTAITSISLPAALTSVAEQAFRGASQLELIDVSSSSTIYVAAEGVLYLQNEGNLYTLVAYPEGKKSESFTALTRTVKVAAYAFAGNPYVREIVLPEYLRIIGAGAFYKTSALETLELRAVAAPVLESYASYDSGASTMNNVYNNFKEALGAELTLSIVVPANATGYYDNYIWQQYVSENLVASDESRINRSALDFIDRVRALPDIVTSANDEEIAALERLYRSLSSEQRRFVEGDYDGTNYNQMLQDKKNAANASVSVEGSTLPGTAPSASSGDAVLVTYVLVIAAAATVFGGVTAAVVRRRRK